MQPKRSEMKKAVFLFIAIIVAAAGFDKLYPLFTVKTDVELFRQNLIYAEMREYRSPDYDYIIRVPSFFSAQPDPYSDAQGHLRFVYTDLWATVVLEGYAMDNQGQSMDEGADSLARALHATHRRRGKDFVILSGPQYEGDSRVDGYSYYAKFVRNGHFWFVYTMVYPDNYKDALARLFREINDWEVWENPSRWLKP